MADPASLAGTVVSGLAKAILGKLGNLVFEEFSLIYGAKAQFRKLQNTLSAIDALLLDAEEKQYRDGAIGNWLMNLKDVAYDIEDVLDLISTERLEREEVDGVNPCRRLTGLYSRYGFAKQVKEICLRLDAIEENQRRFNLQVRAHGELRETLSDRRNEDETCSHITESGVFGREQDKKWIVSRLISSKREQSLVIPITGMGGMEKTTLAQLVYNDPRVTEAFDLKLWVYISKKFVLKTVIENTIQSATGDKCSKMTLQALQSRLHEILTDRTFLLVLDDVWIEHEDLRQWEKLEELLAVGSRKAILVTTREESVAKITGTMEPCKVLELPEDDCWSIFVNCAFKDHKGKPNPSLERIGKSIVQKCKGVPLAVKTMGTFLHRNRDVNKWKEIEESELWMTCKHGILPALKLSYDHTPYKLRSCFAYCALFGKGYPFRRIDLVNIWMAQGLLLDGIEDTRDVGDEYEPFEELLSRSFFQIPGDAVIEKYVLQAAGVFNWNRDWASLAQGFKNKMISDVDSVRRMFTDYRGKLPFVEMHDLFQDLAAYVAREEIVSGISSSSCKISDKARHIAWCKEDLSGKEFPKGLSKPSKVRTFAFLHPMGSLSKSFLESLLLHFKCLRVLMLMESEFEELPDLIGDLNHLRYLDISVNSKLKLLPNAICKLVNLQVLDFGHCNELKKLPKDMHRLVSLRTLIVTSKATCLPKRGFQCWSSIRILKIVGCPNFTSLPEGIGSLEKLRIFGVEHCLKLAFLPHDTDQLTNLEELSIGHCERLDLAQWKGLHGLTKLMYLRLYGIPKLVNFPSGLESVARSLKHFKIGDCKALTSLPEELQHCTSLLKLQVFGCDKPHALPTGIQALEDLQELTIAGCSGLSERCEREKGADWHLISHIPYIHIDNQVIQDNKAASTQQ